MYKANCIPYSCAFVRSLFIYIIGKLPGGEKKAIKFREVEEFLWNFYIGLQTSGSLFCEIRSGKSRLTLAQAFMSSRRRDNLTPCWQMEYDRLYEMLATSEEDRAGLSLVVINYLQDKSRVNKTYEPDTACVLLGLCSADSDRSSQAV